MKSIFDVVKEDLDVRNRIGYEQWKKELYPDDGRDWLLEAYAESLDLAIYLKGEILKREAASLTPQIQPFQERHSSHSPLFSNAKTTNGREPL